MCNNATVSVLHELQICCLENDNLDFVSTNILFVPFLWTYIWNKAFHCWIWRLVKNKYSYTLSQATFSVRYDTYRTEFRQWLKSVSRQRLRSSPSLRCVVLAGCLCSRGRIVASGRAQWLPEDKHSAGTVYWCLRLKWKPPKPFSLDGGRRRV